MLGIYQVLPGPEAHELCCYFGYASRGRLGSIVAGLGFMLPGFFLVLFLAWIYSHYGSLPILLAAFAGMQPAVAALVIRAVHKLGSHALKDIDLWLCASLVFLSQAMGAPFFLPLIASGLAYLLVKKERSQRTKPNGNNHKWNESGITHLWRGVHVYTLS